MSRYKRDISLKMGTKIHQKRIPKVTSLDDIVNEILCYTKESGLLHSEEIEVVVDDEDSFNKMNGYTGKYHTEITTTFWSKFYLKCIFDTFKGIPYTTEANNYI